jgi:4-phytase/acid phosphatase
MYKLVAVALLLSAALVPAQTRPTGTQSAEQLRFILILSRHGIRPPLAPTSVLNQRSTDAWPEWEVPLGYLTPHGGEAIHQMGAYLRTTLAHDGLLAATGCPGANHIYIYADTDERNIMSSFHTFAGFEPGCTARAIHTVALKGPRDPLFSPTPTPPADAITADRRAYAGGNLAAYTSAAQNPELNELAKLLAPDPAHPAAKPLLAEATPLSLAVSLVEDFQLEYIDAKPMNQVGWGRVDAATLHRLMPLHAKGFTLSARAPLAAKSHGSNLMAHMLETLEQAAGNEPVTGAIGPSGTHLVYISGHDTNLFNLAGLLGLNWTAEGLANDTPPDAQLAFELWQNRRSRQLSVRILYRAQTLDQLRSAAPLTAKNKPLEVELVAPGCTKADLCPFAAFDKAVHGLLDPAYIKPEMPELQVTPANY